MLYIFEKNCFKKAKLNRYLLATPRFLWYNVKKQVYQLLVLENKTPKGIRDAVNTR